ncbi:hypothetical protein CPB84DRAFT_1964630 [Gymnopilus junonius]|uniref:C2H2-type domain-containing protein n=1 Tax=Gymnopilus junonius TaxID=109634 RepID=A0A9P5NGE3_GYMJU|nr:hypothetical protein CPB84DRAFT_1964630 [Gymnopilus junonius]
MLQYINGLYVEDSFGMTYSGAVNIPSGLVVPNEEFENMQLGLRNASGVEGVVDSYMDPHRGEVPTAFQPISPFFPSCSGLSHRDLLALWPAMPLSAYYPGGEPQNSVHLSKLQSGTESHAIQVSSGDYSSFFSPRMGITSLASMDTVPSLFTPIGTHVARNPMVMPSSVVPPIHVENTSFLPSRRATSLDPALTTSRSALPSSVKTKRKSRSEPSTPNVKQRRQPKIKTKVQKRPCPLCFTLLSPTTCLKRHFAKLDHGGLGYTCRFCSKIIGREDSLRRHEQNKHKEELECERIEDERRKCELAMAVRNFL